MNAPRFNHFLPAVALLFAPIAPAQDSAQASGAPPQYTNPSDVNNRLQAFTSKYRKRSRLLEIGKSLSGTPITGVALTDGEETNKPAILILAGANGAHAVGVEAALANITQILERAESDTAVAQLLRETVIYVFPLLNPDGAAANHAKPLVSVAGNLRPVDADRDRRTSEDGPDDLNNDGWITMMRIADPAGDWIVDAKDPRIMRKADRSKCERGTHKVYSEGFDNDNDGKYNEDGVDGVRIDRNFPHLWKEFDRATGTSAVSEPESRALADFVVEHPGIAGAIVYGLHDSVRKTPKAGDGGGEGDATDAPRARGARQGGGGAPTSILKEDITIHERAAKLYKETVAAEGDADDAPSDGAIHSWLYFQRGIPTLAVRVWTPPAGKPKDAKEGGEAKDKDKDKDKDRDNSNDKEKKDSQATSKPVAEAGTRSRDGAAGGGDEDKSKTERGRLAWNDTELGGAGFVAWAPVSHPSFSGKAVEVGGWKPGVLINPPAASLDALVRKHTDFVIKTVPEFLPRVVIASAHVTQNGGGLATFKASIRNDGRAPALSAMARRAGASRPVRVKLTIKDGEIVAGRPQYLVSDLAPQDPPREWTWILKGKPGTSFRLEVQYPFGPESVYIGEIK